MDNCDAVFDALNGRASHFITFGNQFFGEESFIDKSSKTINRSERGAEFMRDNREQFGFEFI